MRTAKFLLAVALGSLTLLAHPRAAAGSVTERPQTSPTVKRTVRIKAAPKPPRPRPNLLVTPVGSTAGPLLLPWFFRDNATAAPPSRRRPIMTLEGLLIGDYYLIPNLLFATDSRYDDVNTRERALRDDLNYLDARLHGEIHIDPLTQLLRKQVQRFNDPGFQVAMVIHHLLQGALQPPTRSLEQVMRLNTVSGSPVPAAQASMVAPESERGEAPPPVASALDLRR